MHTCGWVSLLSTWNYHHIANQPHSNIKLKVQFLKLKQKQKNSSLYLGKGTTLASMSLPMTIKGFLPGCVVRQARSEKELWTVRFSVVWGPGKDGKNEEQLPWEGRKEDIGKKRECQERKAQANLGHRPWCQGVQCEWESWPGPQVEVIWDQEADLLWVCFSFSYPSWNPQSALSNSKIWTELHAWQRPTNSNW